MTAERQVGERLSEQESVRLDRSDPNWKQYLVPWLRRAETLNDTAGHWGDAELYGAAADKIEALARQLAEAERERDEALRKAAIYDKAMDRADEMQQQLSAVTNRLLSQRARLRELEELQAHLANPPDPPASPAEGSEDDHARVEHLREAREVEDHQEAKRAARESR